MHTMEQLETKQIGLRMPAHLVEEVDDFIQDFGVNRSTFITESIKNFLKEQKEQRFYDRLEASIKEMKMMMDGKIPKIYARETLKELRGDLENT